MRMFADLSDRELIAETKRLAAAERVATVALIRSLMELDARRLYLGEGCASLFKYCTEVLRLSEDAAYNRMEVARTARRIPAVLDAIERGELTLTAARRLGPHLTPLNCDDVLTSAKFKTKAEIEELIAALSPKPDVAPTIRKLPDAAPAVEPVVTLPVLQRPVEQTPVAAARVDPPRPTSEVKPLAPERYKIQFTIGRETRDKLHEVQDLLRHSIPNGDLADIFDRALTLLLKDARKRRFANTDAPRPGRPLAPDSRTVPSEVQRVVWKRDNSRCAFSGPNGRCTETSFLQFHHKDPFAMGGEATADNIELRCAAHNRYEAELFFGVNYPGIVREVRPIWPNEVFVPDGVEARPAAPIH